VNQLPIGDCRLGIRGPLPPALSPRSGLFLVGLSRWSLSSESGLHIDFLLATQPIALRTRQAEIGREYRKKQSGLTPSDHAPVIADLT